MTDLTLSERELRALRGLVRNCTYFTSIPIIGDPERPFTGQELVDLDHRLSDVLDPLPKQEIAVTVKPA